MSRTREVRDGTATGGKRDAVMSMLQGSKSFRLKFLRNCYCCQAGFEFFDHKTVEQNHKIWINPDMLGAMMIAAIVLQSTGVGLEWNSFDPSWQEQEL